MQRLLVSKENILSDQQEGNQCLDQKDSEPPNMKEEQEELWSEDEEKPQSSQLQSPRYELTEVELLSSSLAEHKILKTEAKGEDCVGSQPAGDSDLQQYTDGAPASSLFQRPVMNVFQKLPEIRVFTHVANISGLF
ncbi:uncharacterized protein LOC117522504 isoform X5 [Thalassophryne amazonica]|uniref:uncharacterized protein LOC117522504 isoform X5 n=1 Tax=Thalassophryne amazonica TaxID=390379 RepID=UPI0014724E19|nr:uncharacterized protein LOC117522504 isoform X5 [Thalassophryne amazonica]